MMLERGSPFTPAVAQGLWRQIELRVPDENRELIRTVFGDAHRPRVFLLARVLNLLGQPLGVGQGNNPSCQSAIGLCLCLWADHAADYLLQLLACFGQLSYVMAESKSDNAQAGGLCCLMPAVFST